MRQRTSKDIFEFFRAGIYCLVLPLRVVVLPSKTPLEIATFSFASGYQLEITSGLGIGDMSVSFYVVGPHLALCMLHQSL